jgi:hypothetical protein
MLASPSANVGGLTDMAKAAGGWRDTFQPPVAQTAGGFLLMFPFPTKTNTSFAPLSTHQS